MITKEYLDEYEKNIKNYNYEVNKLTKDIQLEYKNMTVDSVVGSSKSFPYIKGNKTIEGINNSRIKKLEKRKEYFKRKIQKAEKELKYKIDNLEDKHMADIIEKKYIKKMGWKQVQQNINSEYADESGPRRYFDRYFRKI